MILTINKMQLPVSIGIFAWEMQVKQTLIFDLDLQIDFSKAILSDEVVDTIDYVAVQSFIQAFCATQHFNLVERLASLLADQLVTKFELQALRVRVTKSHTLEKTESITVDVMRGKFTT